MKRGGHLTRTAWVRATPRPAVPASRYRPTVTAAERRARTLVSARSGLRCEGCGRAAATDYAHRVARSQGGPWCAANALHLCRACHAWFHAEPVMARSVGWALRSGQDPAVTPALLHGIGHVLLTADGGHTPYLKETG